MVTMVTMVTSPIQSDSYEIWLL